MKTPEATVAAAPLLTFPHVATFEYLNETQGAHRLQEIDDEGTPLTNDADGASISALYLRKAKFGDAQPGEKFRVTVEKIS